MNLKIIIFLGFIAISSVIKAQDKITISGTVKDDKTTETLIGVNIYIPELKIGTSTNGYGFYSLTIPHGKYTIQSSYQGFQTYSETLEFTSSLNKDISLTDDVKNIEEIILTGDNKRSEIKKAEMSTNKLNLQTIKKMPVVFGEVDIIKSI